MQRLIACFSLCVCVCVCLCERVDRFHSILITYISSDEKLVAFQPSVTASTTGSVRNASTIGVLHTQATEDARVMMRFVLNRNTILVQTYALVSFANVCVSTCEPCEE
jgi:hypothetical protein